MTVLEYQRLASEIRARLRRPPNPVKDSGIDLKRLKRGWRFAEKKPPPPIPEVQDYPRPPPKNITLNLILAVAAAQSGLTVKDLIKPDRRRQQTLVRHIAIFLASIHTKMTYGEIGIRLHRDHTTCLYAKEKIAVLAHTDEAVAQKISKIESVLFSKQLFG